MPRVLLNVDAGELADEPDALYAAAHVAHVACGGHAGDDASMRRALDACKRHATRAGAHPSYDDREGFGRRPQALAPAAAQALVEAQCARLAAAARAVGVPLASVKPHGALYHAADRDDALADALATGAARALGAPRLVGPPGGALARAAARAGLAFEGEAFADRATRADGTLVPRGEPGALLVDPAACAARARALAANPAIATICVHGDSPGALAILRAVRAALDGMDATP